MATWKIDPAHTSVTFGVRHAMVATVRGTFSGVRGTLDFDPAAPERAAVEVSIPTASVDTGDGKRDAHLKSPDFFDAERYPEITFKSRHVEPDGAKQYRIEGDLTIRGVTKPVVLGAELFGIRQDSKVGTRAGFAATTAINRRDFGLEWDMPLDNGGVLVGERVKIELDVAAVQQAEAAA